MQHCIIECLFWYRSILNNIATYKGRTIY